jgi:hypothetical protein
MLSPFSARALHCLLGLEHDNLIPPASTLRSDPGIGHGIGSGQTTQKRFDNIAVGCIGRQRKLMGVVAVLPRSARLMNAGSTSRYSLRSDLRRDRRGNVPCDRGQLRANRQPLYSPS